MLAKFPVLMKRGSEVGMERGREMGPKLEAAMDAAIQQIRDQQAKDTRENVENAMKQVHAQEARDASAAPAPAGDDNKPQQAADEKSKSNDQPKK